MMRSKFQAQDYDRLMQEIARLESESNRDEAVIEAMRCRAEIIKKEVESNLADTVDVVERAMIHLSGVADAPMGPITSHNSPTDQGQPGVPTNPNTPQKPSEG